MKPFQTKLLRRLQESFRHAIQNREPRMAFVEVGWINGVNPKTANSLVNAGLAVYDSPPATVGTESGMELPYIRLPIPLWYEDADRDFGLPKEEE